LDVGEGHIGRMRTVELPLQGSVGHCGGGGVGRLVPAVDEGRVKQVVGVYEVHKASVDFGVLVVVEGGGQLGSLLEGKWFVAKDGEGSKLCQRNMCREVGLLCLSVT
jgi:hypothetical protein